MEITAEKGICLVIFFLTTMLAGSIPILLYSQCRGRMSSRRGQVITSLFNCFAGGVFLATCLLNLLVEGLEKYEEYKVVAKFDCDYPLFHLAIGLGFFAVAFVERLAILMSKHGLMNGGKDDLDPEGIALESVRRIGEVVRTDAAKRTREDVSEKQPNSSSQFVNLPDRSPQSDCMFTITDSTPPATVSPNGCNNNCGLSGDPQNSDPGDEKPENTEIFTGHSGVIAITIFLALSFHTIFDGLAVGLQETQTDIWTTAIAINVHKTIVAVSLGLELATTTPGKPWRALLFLFVFALMAPLGVAIGMGVTSGNLDVRAHLVASGVLQAVATGSFLYVTFFEILGEELGHRSSVLKIFITLLGFAAMAVAKIWDTD